MNNTIAKLEEKFGNVDNVQENLSLPTIDEDTGCTISWLSSNQDIISNLGVYNRPYLASSITLTASVTHGEVTDTVDYIFNVKGYKDLTNGVAAVYLYTNISSTSDYTYENVDVAFVAFGTAGSTGTISNITTIGNTIKNNVITKAHNNGVYVLLSINGTANLSIIAADSTLRTTFANNIVAAINTYDLDGIDIDWEFPSSSEKGNFTLLMKEISEKVKANNPNHLVTAATGVSAYANYDFANSSQYLDFICMMTYDMETSYTAHHSALYSNSSTYNTYSANWTFTKYTSSGVPANKIILGVPFYGKKYTNTDGLGQTRDSAKSAITYSVIVSSYLNNPSYIRYFDDICKVPYLYDSVNKIFITYDDPESIEIKCQYIASKNLAGIFCWQDGQDSLDTLITAMVDGLSTYYK